MTIQNLKDQFFEALKNSYQKTEIDSFLSILVAFKLYLKRIDLALNPNQNISDKDVEFFREALERLRNQEPIQYILGNTEFFGLLFKVDKSVLIPRPETEELVSLILKTAKSQKPIADGYKILDLGTGSGCIAIALARHLPKAEVWALDISKEALNIAQQNADLNEVAINFVEADILNLKTLHTKFDIIVSNPPYVKQNEKSLMKPNVLNYEPHLALFVSDDNSLIFYDKIATFAKTNLKPNGTLFFEINQYLGNELTQLLKQKGFINIELRQDLYEVDRIVSACIKK